MAVSYRLSVFIILVHVWASTAVAQQVRPLDQELAADPKQLVTRLRQIDRSDPLAVKKLIELGREQIDLQDALGRVRSARLTDPLYERLNPIDGGIYGAAKAQTDLDQTFLSLLSQNLPVPVAHDFFVSFLLSHSGLQDEAAYFFNRAALMKQLAANRVYTDMLRPLHYEFPSVYDEMGIPRFSPYQLQTIRFLDDEQLKLRGLMTQRGLGGPSVRLDGGLYLTHDTNVLKLASGAPLPNGFGNKSGTGQIVFARFGVQTNPSRKFNAGFEFNSALIRHTRGDLGARDTWTNLPSAWISLWNAVDNEVRLRYDYAHNMRDRHALRFHRQTQGPQLAWSHLWNRRYQTDLAYSYKRHFYPHETLSGTEHAALLELSYPGKSAAIQPFVRYTFSHNWPEAAGFKTNTHRIALGTSYLLNANATLRFETAYALGLFPQTFPKRKDQLRSFRLNGAYQLFSALNAFLDVTYLDNASSLKSQFAYSEWTFVLGLVAGTGL